MWRMAKVFGAAGTHAGRQSVAAFKRMFATLLIVSVVVAFFGGGLVAALFITHSRNLISWIAGLAGIVTLLWLLTNANRKVDQQESTRMARRKGALGEYEVGAGLERLSDSCAAVKDGTTDEYG